MVKLKHYIVGIFVAVGIAVVSAVLAPAAAEEYGDMERVQCFTAEQEAERQELMNDVYDQGADDYHKFLKRFVDAQCNTPDTRIILNNSRTGLTVELRCPK